MFGTYVGTILTIAACFGIIYGFNILKITFKEKSQGQILSWICSIVIIAVN